MHLPLDWRPPQDLDISLPRVPHPGCDQDDDPSWHKECLTHLCNFRPLIRAWLGARASGIVSE